MGRSSKFRPDHEGDPLPPGIYRRDSPSGVQTGYKARWRERTSDGQWRHHSRSFSARRYGSLEDALREATTVRQRAVEHADRIGADEEPVPGPEGDPAGRMTLNELFAEWRHWRGPAVSEMHRKRMARFWREISGRNLGGVRLERISRDPALLVRFQDELTTEQVKAPLRLETLKTLRAVLHWGRRRHPNALNVQLAGLFKLPTQRRRQLPFVTDAYGLERLIEAVRARPVYDEYRTERDVAFVAAMGFTVAARPSEWLHSVRWRDVHETSVDLQQSGAPTFGPVLGLKSGARGALLLRGASLRLASYRDALEERFGEQPPHGLVFQAIDHDGPIWTEVDGEEVPVSWTKANYLNWTGRVWRPARVRAALCPDVDQRMESMRFYDCRHTAVSLALHSNLVVNEYGMNLFSLAAWAGHDVQTMQGYYAHIISRYFGQPAIDLEKEWETARERVASEPSEHLDDWLERSEREPNAA
ncbi:MAG TPA: hypothetical protein VIT85_07940 [Solirubrobacterales bacterium]